jgi:hypothetical protein
MNDRRSFERLFADRMNAEPGSPRLPDAFYDDFRHRAGEMRQRPRWLAIIKEPPMRHTSRVVVGSPTARVAALTAATLLLGLVATGAFVAGAQSPAPALPEQESAPQLPVEVTGVWCIGPAVADRADAWRNAVSMSDPRLQGNAYQTYETRTYPGGISLTSSTLSIVNEDGAWVSRRYRSTGTPAGVTDTGDVFIGEGAYEGLIVFWPEDGPVVARPEGLSAEYGSCMERQGVIIDGAVAKPYRPE